MEFNANLMYDLFDSKPFSDETRYSISFSLIWRGYVLPETILSEKTVYPEVSDITDSSDDTCSVNRGSEL